MKRSKYARGWSTEQKKEAAKHLASVRDRAVFGRRASLLIERTMKVAREMHNADPERFSIMSFNPIRDFDKGVVALYGPREVLLQVCKELKLRRKPKPSTEFPAYMNKYTVEIKVN